MVFFGLCEVLREWSLVMKVSWTKELFGKVVSFGTKTKQEVYVV